MSGLLEKRLSRRNFLKASAAMAGASLVAACAPPAAAPAAAPAAGEAAQPAETTVTLITWVQGDPLSESPYNETRNKIIAMFEEANPGIKLQLEGSSERIDEKVLLTVKAGNPPDLTMVSAQMRESHVHAGTLRDLEDYLAMEDKAWLDDLPGIHNANATSSVDGKRYCILLSLHSRLIYYRTDMCPAEPSSWQDIVDFGKAVADPDKGIWGYNFFGNKPWSVEVEFGPFIWMQGANTCENDGRATFATDAAEAAILFHRDLIHVHKISSIANVTSGFGDMWAQFQAGQVAMCVQGTYAFPIGVKEQMKELWEAGKVWGAPIPPKEKGGNSANFANGWAWGIPRGSKHSDEAWKFIRFHSRPDIQVMHSQVEGGAPITKSAWTDKTLYADEIWGTVMLPNLEKWGRPMDPYVYYMEELTALAVAIEESLINPDSDIMGNLKRAEEEFNKKYYPA